MRNQQLYNSPAIDVYGLCRLRLPWLIVPCWFFCNPGLKNCNHGKTSRCPRHFNLEKHWSTQILCYLTTNFWFGTIQATDETFMSVIIIGILENIFFEGSWDTCFPHFHQGGCAGKFTPYLRGKSISFWWDEFPIHPLAIITK